MIEDRIQHRLEYKNTRLPNSDRIRSCVRELVLIGEVVVLISIYAVA
jgi:hypothetical protein